MLIGKLTMTFLTGQSRHILRSWYMDGGPEQRFWCCFADIRWTFKSKTKTMRVKFTCGAGYCTGHQSTAGQVPVMLFGRTCFCLNTTCFWPVKCITVRTFAIMNPNCIVNLFLNKKPTES